MANRELTAEQAQRSLEILLKIESAYAHGVYGLTKSRAEVGRLALEFLEFRAAAGFTSSADRAHSISLIRDRIAPYSGGKNDMDVNLFIKIHMLCQLSGATPDSLAYGKARELSRLIDRVDNIYGWVGGVDHEAATELVRLATKTGAEGISVSGLVERIDALLPEERLGERAKARKGKKAKKPEQDSAPPARDWRKEAAASLRRADAKDGAELLWAVFGQADWPAVLTELCRLACERHASWQPVWEAAQKARATTPAKPAKPAKPKKEAA